MAKLIKEITKPVKVGIYDNCRYSARLFPEKVIVRTPYIRWVRNSGNLAIRLQVITHQGIVNRIIQETKKENYNSAWSIIGNYLGDPFLEQSGL